MFEPQPDDRYALCVFQSLVLTVTNGLDVMYRVVLDQTYMEEHRRQTGIEGSWTSYFELLRQALDNQSIGLFSDDDGIVLKIHYPLMAGARISG